MTVDFTCVLYSVSKYLESECPDNILFGEQIQCMEETDEALRGRCLKFYKGCRKYT